MVASVCKRRKLDENKVVFLHRRTQLFRHGTPEIVRMPTEAVVGGLACDAGLICAVLTSPWNRGNAPRGLPEGAIG